MSLESEIQNLTVAVENLAFIIKQLNVTQKPVDLSTVKMHPSIQATENVYAPLRTEEEVKKTTIRDVVKEAAVIAGVPEADAMHAVQSGAVQMPGLPTFAPPPSPGPAQVTHGKAPFNDAKGLMDYLMKSYTTLGAEKGAKIQEVMKALGASAVNEVKPEQYDVLFAGVEALK